MSIPMEPIWEAVRFESVLRTGRTMPLLLECQRGRGNTMVRGRFVTKVIGLPEVNNFSLCHEFVGARLARLMGLAAPDVALVNLSSEFLGATRSDLEAARVRPSAGVGVGSLLIPNLQPFPASASLADAEIVEAARIYAFDLLVQNADRRAASPNCGRAEGHVVPFDFENAFGFRFALARPEPWQVSRLGFARQHLFFSELAKCQLIWSEILAPFQSLTMAAVADLCATIPTAWAEIGTDIRAHIEAVFAHWPEFSHEVAVTLGDSL